MFSISTKRKHLLYVWNDWCIGQLSTSILEVKRSSFFTQNYKNICQWLILKYEWNSLILTCYNLRNGTSELQKNGIILLFYAIVRKIKWSKMSIPYLVQVTSNPEVILPPMHVLFKILVFLNLFYEVAWTKRLFKLHNCYCQ